MAHFMKTFRKNRKVMLAVLTLLAMLSFVFLPTVMEIMSTGGRRKNPVVVKTTKYGSLTQSQLDQLISRRQRLYAFYQQTAMALQRKGGRGGAVSQSLGMLGNAGSEEAAVQDWLRTRKAEELGLKVSQSAINDHLALLSEGKLGDSDVREILGRLHMSQPQLFESLRQEMLSMRLLQMFGDSLGATTPDQRWGYFQQLNRRAKIEAVPVAAIKFVDKIQDPSPEALREFFDKHKNKLADLDSPEPGFREPHRIDVEYLKATVETFMNPAAVSEAAIRDYYEANKDRLYKDMLPEGPAPVAPTTGPAKPEAAKAEPAKDAAPGKDAPKAQTPKSEPPKTEPAKPALPKSEPPKADAPKPEAANPVPPKLEPPKQEEPKGKAAPTPDKKSSVVRRSPFRLVSGTWHQTTLDVRDRTVPCSRPAEGGDHDASNED